jgi:iron complex transport system substrate-binding protein
LSDLAEAIGSVGDRPRVACVEWLDPLMIAGHWVPELVRLAGGIPLLTETGSASRTVDLETLRQSRPDLIVVQVCGFDLEQTRREWNAQPDLAQAFHGWQDAAGDPVRVAFTDGDAYFNRPGPRLVDSAELLAEICHPTRPRQYEGRGWES